jgi:hypothetical protein
MNAQHVILVSLLRTERDLIDCQDSPISGSKSGGHHSGKTTSLFSHRMRNNRNNIATGLEDPGG